MSVIRKIVQDGGSSAIRIPKLFLMQMNLDVGDPVELNLMGEQIIVKKAPVTLENLKKTKIRGSQKDSEE